MESANFLNELMPVFKISSSDLTNKPFIKYMASFGKPIILSTGASDLSEVYEAVSWIEEFNVPYALLHCVLNYPTLDQNANLGMIPALKKAFPDVLIGYSDHTLPKDMKTLETATLLGSLIIEKHFTHDKTLTGNDHYHAMDKEDLKIFLNKLEIQLQLLGEFQVKSLLAEEPARHNARRSLVAKRDIPKDKIIDSVDLTFKRPAHGISPKFIDELIGKKAIFNIEEDSILQWQMFR